MTETREIPGTHSSQRLSIVERQFEIIDAPKTRKDVDSRPFTPVRASLRAEVDTSGNGHVEIRVFAAGLLDTEDRGFTIRTRVWSGEVELTSLPTPVLDWLVPTVEKTVASAVKLSHLPA